MSKKGNDLNLDPENENSPKNKVGADAPVKLTINHDYRGFKKSPGKMDTFSKRITDNSVGNPNFQEADATKLIDKVVADRNAFVTAWGISQTSRLVRDKTNTEQMILNLIGSLDTWSDFVLLNSNGLESILKSTGFEMHIKPVRNQNAGATPTNIKKKLDESTGVAYLTCDSMGKKILYTAYAVDTAGKVIVAGTSMVSKRIPIKNLEKNKSYQVYLTSTNAVGEGDPSAPWIEW